MPSLPRAAEAKTAGFWVALIFGNFAVLLLLGAAVSASLTARFLASAEAGEARVLSTAPFRMRNATSHDTAVVLTLPSGQEVRDTWRRAEYYAPGEMVPVLYRTQPSVSIQPVLPEGPWVLSWALLGLGAAFGTVAALTYMVYRMRRRAPAAAPP